jgi:hypothetical protein
LFTASLLALALPSVARAQDVEKQVTRMNKKAMEDYDSLEFDSARKTLIDAVAMLRSNGLDETPLAAKTFLNLGTLYIAGFKDRTRGQQQFVNALKIKPDIRLDPAIATPELDEAFAAAQKIVGKGKPAVVKPPPVENKPPPVENKPPPIENKPPPVENKPPVTSPEDVKGLQHNPIDESKPNTIIPVKAQLGSDAGATRVFLFYRAGGQEDYVSVPMKNVGGADWVGAIPADAVVGRALQYYLEARDARGRAVVGSGSAPNPYIISISETAPPPAYTPEVDVEDPLAAERARKRREEEERAHGKLHRLFVFVYLGTGFGYEPSGNHTEVAYQYQPTGPNADTYIRQPIGTGGVAFAPLHIGLEFGGMITRGFGLSGMLRYQVFTAANAETQDPGSGVNAPTKKATGAVAGLVRARYRFLDGRVHPYVHVDFGGGQIRHTLDISTTTDHLSDAPLVDRYTGETYNLGDKNPPGSGMTSTGIQQVCANRLSCTDTISLGYLFVGGGAGLWIDVHKYLALIVDVNLLGAIGIGDGQSGMNIDVNLGFGAHF